MYALLFLFGFVGFVGMAGLGFLHSGNHSHAGSHGGIRALPNAHGARVHLGAKSPGAKVVRGARSWWAISPFDVLAFCVGAGAVGEILRQGGVAPGVTLAAAILGALVFDLGLAKPLLGALLRFESRPSAGLEGSTAQRVEAISRFDAQGRGLVRVALDGQLVQVLAHLDPEERACGVVVAKGDPLLVVDIDAGAEHLPRDAGARVVRRVDLRTVANDRLRSFDRRFAMLAIVSHCPPP